MEISKKEIKDFLKRKEVKKLSEEHQTLISNLLKMDVPRVCLEDLNYWLLRIEYVETNNKAERTLSYFRNWLTKVSYDTYLNKVYKPLDPKYIYTSDYRESIDLDLSNELAEVTYKLYKETHGFYRDTSFDPLCEDIKRIYFDHFDYCYMSKWVDIERSFYEMVGSDSLIGLDSFSIIKNPRYKEIITFYIKELLIPYAKKTIEECGFKRGNKVGYFIKGLLKKYKSKKIIESDYVSRFYELFFINYCLDNYKRSGGEHIVNIDGGTLVKDLWSSRNFGFSGLVDFFINDYIEFCKKHGSKPTEQGFIIHYCRITANPHYKFNF